MIFGIGIDMIEISRIQKGMVKPSFLKKLFTKNEIQYFKTRSYAVETVAGNFAAKEAVVKSLGVGFSKFLITDLEVLRDEKGKPIVTFTGKAEAYIKEMKVSHVHISISHNKEHAAAIAIAEKKEGD